MNPILRRVVLLFVLLLFCGAQACGSEPPGQGDSEMASEPHSFLALGDSYTIGESVDSVFRWPVQLARALGREGVPVQEPIIIARTGWTTDELMAGIEAAGLSGTYDMVSLLIGVNNQYRGRDLEEYRAQLRNLLSQAIAFAGGEATRVLVLSIPDWGVMPFAEGRDRHQIAREIDSFNAVKRGESEAAGVRYVDVTGMSRGAATDSDLVAVDGLHPSGTMYGLWATAALPAAKEILRPGQDGKTKP